MSDLVRKQIYITREQENILKSKSARLGMSEAEIIRDALDRYVHKVSFPRRSAERWQVEKAFIRGRTDREKFGDAGSLKGDEIDE